MSEMRCRNALQGVKVLELTHYEAGPTCALMLAFLGAEVIKIESPIKEKSNRRLFLGEEGNEDLYFVLLNLNKRSVTLDIESEEGHSLFIDLVKISDVLIENFGLEKMQLWGLDFETLKKHNPRLIYGSISGYGLFGPYSSYPSLDMTAQAMGGLMSMTGNEDDLPLRCGFAISDTLSGTNLALGITAALYRREKTGKGATVDVSLHDSTISCGRSVLGTHIAYGSKAPKTGNKLEDVVPWNIYKTKEGGYVAICIVQQRTFENLMNIIGKNELIEKYKLYSLKSRKEKCEIIEKVLFEWVISRTKMEVMELLCNQNIPCGAVLDSKDIGDDPHLCQRGMIVEIVHHEWGKIKVLGCPVKFGDSHIKIKSSPKLGEHNQKIFSKLLGLSQKKIQNLKDRGII